MPLIILIVLTIIFLIISLFHFVTLPIFGLASRRVFKFKNSCYQ